MSIGYALMQADIAGKYERCTGGNYWNAFSKSIAFSGISAIASYGIGTLFSNATGILGELARAGTHGLASGIISQGMNGDFNSAFIGGFISSFTGSLLNNYGGVIFKDPFTMGMASGIVGGGVSSVTGGEFGMGFIQGFMIGALNHGMHGNKNSPTSLSGQGGGDYTIEMNRIAESPDATVSEFNAYGPIPLRTVSGYILEPGSPSTITRGQDKRIPAGTYIVTPYSSTKHPNVYRVSNSLVPTDRYILFHTGNYHLNTSGCLLPGRSYSMVSGNYAVWNSSTTLNQLRGLLGMNNATLIIRDINPCNFNLSW